MSPEDKLAQMGLALPPTPTPAGNYVPWKRDGAIAYLAGQGPRKADGSFSTGKVGGNVTVETAYEHAKLVGLQILASAKAAAGGDLSKVEFLKVLGMVNAAPDFGDHPRVINGFSDLMVAVLGDRGRHARSTIGVAELLLDAAVEVEAMFEVR